MSHVDLDGMGQSARRWQFGWCEYVEISRTLLVRGVRSELRGKPLDLLQLLLTHPEKVLPNETLIQRVWGNASRQSLTVAISKLRKAFGGDLDDVIQNVASAGYRMAVPVECLAAEEPLSPLLGLEVGRFIPRSSEWKAVRRLGGPDHSPVWLAEREDTGEQRVYKFATDGVRLRALQREEAVERILMHTGAKPERLRGLYEVNFSESPYFLAGEYVGPSLQEFFDADAFRNMSRSDRVDLMAMLADAVAVAHGMGVLHNDLKPNNVLVRRLLAAGQEAPVSDQYALVLIDFGESSLVAQDLKGASDLQQATQDIFQSEETLSYSIGSEMYRAPELRHGGTASAEADIYALGVILFQAIVGSPYQAPLAGWQQDVLDPLLEEDIARAVNRDPQRRFRTAAALAERLQQLEQRRLQAAEIEKDRMRLIEIQRDLDRARAVRPWLATALVTLASGVLISGLFYRSAVRERNAALHDNRSLQSMLTFLSEDVLSQSNPSSGVPGSNRAIDLTLSEAVLNAVPQIDYRFPHDPVVAAKLHETIADGFRARTQFVQADKEYRVAAEKYRAAQGPLSEAAISVELKRDAASLAGLLPGAVARAHANFDEQEKLIQKLPRPEPMVLILADFVRSGLMGLEGDPAKAVAPLQLAIERAQATPGFDPLLLLWIKGRYCGLYVRMQDGPRLYAAAEDRIRDISLRYGRESPMLVSYEMYLQEALFLQGRYQNAIEQADRNYPRFRRLLGDRNQYTLAVLANRAASLAQLGRYSEARSNDLQLYSLEADDPSGLRLKFGSLSDAALYACRAGRFREGLANARDVAKGTGPGPASMPGFFNASKYIEAECLIAEQEMAGHTHPQELATAEALLKQVDTAEIARQTGDSGYGAFVELAKARLAVLRHNNPREALSGGQAQAYFASAGADPYESQQYRRLVVVSQPRM